MKKPSKATTKSDRRRAAFARDVTRAVFGRHYWDDRQQAELDKAMRQPKPKDR